jgi:large subunit ribosomal protein L24
MKRIRKGDTVMVLAGEYRGKEGVVLKIEPKKNRAIVEGVNFVKRHVRPTQKSPQGGIVEKEAPIHLSNLTPIGK